MDPWNIATPDAPAAGGMPWGGTVLWLGPIDVPQCFDAYRFCAEHASQIAPRRSIADFLQRPAERVGHVVHVRLDRSPPPAEAALLVQRCEGARMSLLLGSECEGEERSGTPWRGFESFYWHRWNQVLPRWLGGRWQHESRHHRRRCVGIISAYRDTVDGLADWLAGRGHTVFWTPRLTGTAIRNMDICLWDDSAAPPATTAVWRTRLSAVTRAAGRPHRVRHIWMTGFPRVADWTAARRAGVESMLTKPFSVHALGDCVAGALGNAENGPHQPPTRGAA